MIREKTKVHVTMALILHKNHKKYRIMKGERVVKCPLALILHKNHKKYLKGYDLWLGTDKR